VRHAWNQDHAAASADQGEQSTPALLLARTFRVRLCLVAHALLRSLFVSRRVQAEDEDGTERVGGAPRVRKRRRADEDEEEEEEEEEEVQEEEEEEAVEVEDEPVAPRRGQSSSKRARADSSSSQQSRRGASAAAAPSRRTSHV